MLTEDMLTSVQHPQWKVLVVDENSQKIIDNVVKQDDILNHNIARMATLSLKLDRSWSAARLPALR
jgi:syntaxin-binding protein 1